MLLLRGQQQATAAQTAAQPAPTSLLAALLQSLQGLWLLQMPLRMLWRISLRLTLPPASAWLLLVQLPMAANCGQLCCMPLLCRLLVLQLLLQCLRLPELIVTH